LHVFGCAYWPNHRSYNTHKLQFRSKRCVFLGYSILHKGFKYLDPGSGRVYISQDVAFDESIFPFFEFNPNAGGLQEEISLLSNGVLQSNDHVLRCSTNPATNHGLHGENSAIIQEEVAASNEDPALDTKQHQGTRHEEDPVNDLAAGSNGIQTPVIGAEINEHATNGEPADYPRQATRARHDGAECEVDVHAANDEAEQRRTPRAGRYPCAIQFCGLL
jgi:hypothetical protein